MSEESIIKVLAGWIDNRKYPYQVPRAFIYNWECDFWCMTTHGETREFEIKTSRADYLKDAKKEKHNGCAGANYFYYVCPKDLIKPEEIDKRYGLIYIWHNAFIEVKKKPKRLNDYKFQAWKMLANKMYLKWYVIWKEKWVAKEITRDQFFEGFNIQLEEHSLTPYGE